MISPLITITYSIDKMGDKKAQALGAWLKELSYNILIQPFHAIIFLSFYSSMQSMVSTSIAPYIFMIVLLNFMTKAEDIVRHIFHFEAHHMSSMSDAAQTLGNAQGTFVKLGNASTKAFSNFRKAGGLRAAAPWAFKDLGKGKTKKQKASKTKATSSSGAPLPSPGGSQGSSGSSGDGSGTKPTTAQKMKAKVDAAREKLTNRKKMSKDEKAVESKVRQKIDGQTGMGTYDKLKEKAANGDKGAQQFLQATRNEAQAEYDNEKKEKQQKKDKKAQEKREAKIEKAVKKNIDKKYGKGSYENLKKQEDDPNHKGHQGAKTILDDERSKEKKKEFLKKNKASTKKSKETKDENSKEKKSTKSKTKEQTKTQKAIENNMRERIDSKLGVGAYENLKKKAANGDEGAKKYLREERKDAIKDEKQKRDEKIEKTVKKNIDKKYGKGSYDNLKEQENDPSHKGHQGAKAILDDARKKEKKKIIDAQNKEHEKISSKADSEGKRTISGVKNTASNGSSQTYTSSNNSNNTSTSTTTNNSTSTTTNKKTIIGRKSPTIIERFVNPRTKQGKASQALFQDTAKVAAAIAMGGFAFGATDKIQTAISVGQFGYGVASGIFENANKTATDDLTDMVQKYMNINGGDFDLSELPKILDEIKKEATYGMFDRIDDMQKKLSSDLEKYIKKSSDRQDLFFDIHEAIGTDGANLDIDQLFQKHFASSSLAQADADQIKESLREFSSTLAKASIAKDIEKVEATGMSMGEASRTVERHLEKIEVDVDVNQSGNRTTVNVGATSSSGSRASSSASNANGSNPVSTPNNPARTSGSNGTGN